MRSRPSSHSRLSDVYLNIIFLSVYFLMISLALYVAVSIAIMEWVVRSVCRATFKVNVGSRGGL